MSSSSSAQQSGKWPHTLKVKLEEGAKAPQYQTEGAAGLDLYCSEKIIIPVKGREWVKTGVSVVLPPGTYGEIVDRSSYARKGIDVGAGTIDTDYRGNIGVLVINNTGQPLAIQKGERFAQMIVKEYVKVNVEVVGEDEELEETVRGTGGYGSTGNGL
jgi:dUTP pyrophosphatase